MRWRDLGVKPLGQSSLAEVTGVGHAQESELRSLDFAALLRHRHRTRPPAREVRMGRRYERTRFYSETGNENSPSKYYITAL